MVDEAFALVYPEFSSKLVQTFPPATKNASGGAKDTSLYLTYPLQADRIESFIGASSEGLTTEIFVTTPAVATVFPASRLGANTVGINLLAPENSFLSVEWDGEWAYRELGLIAGYRLASLRNKEGSNASAAILFSRGIGRSSKELDAFAQAFGEGMRFAEGDGADTASASEALSVFDVDSMNLPGDRLEQTLSALRQAEDKKPRLLVLASGSRLALETAVEAKATDIMADLRGLGPNLPTTKIFAAVGENGSALIAAIEHLAQKIKKRETVTDAILVKPELILSKEARHIKTIVESAVHGERTK